MSDKYSKIIRKYEERIVENEQEITKLMKVRNFYRVRRPEFFGNTMLIVSIFPLMASMFGILFFVNKDNLDYVNLIMLSIVVFCCFVIAPIVVFIEKRKIKDLDHLSKDKSKDDIIVDDFRNFYDRLLISSEFESNNKVIEEVEKEKTNFIDKEKMLDSLKKDYYISQKEKEVKDNSEEIKALKLLDKEYKEVYEKELKKFAIIEFFGKCFKQDVLRIFMNGMMVGMMAMIILNLPMICGVMQGGTGDGNILISLFLNIFAPAGIGVLSPALILMYQRYRFKNALQTIYNEIEEPLDFSKYEFVAKEEAKNKLEEIQEKIIINTVKTELLITE